MLFEHSCVLLCKANGAKATIVSVFTGAWMIVHRNVVIESCIWKQRESIAWVC